MKYKCLIFDHDDTTVDSTRNIHYPCYLEFVKKNNYDLHCTLEEYVQYNFDPGLFEFYRKICKFSEEEIENEIAFWRAYVNDNRAKAFPGIREIMEKHRAAGGILAVVSHSQSENILKDYAFNGLPVPDIIFGFEQPRDELKPSPIPVRKIMEAYSLKPEDVLVIDDLKPGYVMARAAGVDFCAASWCFDIPENTRFMRENADYYCKTTEELARIVE